MKIALAEIKVNARQRSEIESSNYLLHTLASSIRKTKGPVQKIVVDENFNLIAGERRLEAVKLLHATHPNEEWDKIEVDIRSGVEDDMLFHMELEENLHRKNLTPEEYHKSLLSYHTTQTADNPDIMKGPSTTEQDRWTQQNTADALGVSRPKISEDLYTAGILASLPDEEQKEIYKKAEGNLKAVNSAIKRRVQKAKLQLEAQRETDAALAQDSEDREEATLTDALVGLASMPDKSVDLIITDPPYGMLVDSAGSIGIAGTQYADRSFSDDADEVLELMNKAIPEFRRVLRDGCHIYMFCGISWKHKAAFHVLGQMYSNAGFNVRSLPLVWCKNVTQGFKPPGTHWPLTIEGILFATTGKRQVDKVPATDFLLHTPIAGNSKRHRFEKPVSLIRELVRVSGIPDGRLLDPFCGSGAILEAGRQRQMHVQGFDNDPESISESRKRLAAWDAKVLKDNADGEDMIRRMKAW